MNIALIGATGFVGSALLAEALARGHRVTAIARSAGRLPAREGVSPVAVDVNDADALAQALRGSEAVLSAFVGNRHGSDPGGDITRGYGSILDAVKRAGVPRLLVVGGAGSLEVAPGQRVVDQPGFPAEYKAESLAMGDVLDRLRGGHTAFEWTLLSPSAEFTDGARTGQFRLGDDQLLVDGNGRSHIAVKDYAVAMLDELERPTHTGRRFTVGY